MLGVSPTTAFSCIARRANCIIAQNRAAILCPVRPPPPEDVMKLVSLLASVVIAPMLAAPAAAQAVSIITTPAGSFSNSGGAAMAKVVSDKARLRMIVQAQASTGFDELEAGSVEFNVSNS